MYYGASFIIANREFKKVKFCNSCPTHICQQLSKYLSGWKTTAEFHGAATSAFAKQQQPILNHFDLLPSANWNKDIFNLGKCSFNL